MSGTHITLLGVPPLQRGGTVSRGVSINQKPPAGDAPGRPPLAVRCNGLPWVDSLQDRREASPVPAGVALAEPALSRPGPDV